MTSQAEKIIETREDVDKLPSSLIDARLGVIGKLELFEDAFANLCAGVASTVDVPAIALAHAQIRANCLGASDGDILKFNLGSPSNYSGITSFTYPSLTGGSGGKPKFGVLVRDRDLSYTITLSGDSGSTATSTESDGTSNTYSNYIGDYYFVRSRETGKLVSFMANTTPYVNPSVDMLFGNTVPFGDSVTLEIGNWNEKFAYANIGTVEFNGTQDQFVTLSHTLDQGSDETAVSPPKIGDYIGLKRFNHDYEMLTITANTTTDLVTNATGNTISTSNASMLIAGAELSNPAWTSNLTVTAVDSDNNIVILNKNVDKDYTNLEITSKQIIPGREENTLFAIAQIVPEGMQPDPSWKPVGDDDGDYSGANESFEDLTLMTKSAFETALSVFHPATAEGSSLDLFKSAAPDITSSSQEVTQDAGNYNNKEANPFFPAVEGARDNSADGGLQPSGLGMKDIFAGRFVKFEKNRKNTADANIGDYRYMIDFAAKFFYLVSPFTSAHNYAPTVTSLPHGSAQGSEPQSTFTPQLQPAMTRVADALDGAGSGTTLLTSSPAGYIGTGGTVPAAEGWQGSNYNTYFTWGSASNPSNVTNTTACGSPQTIDIYEKNSSTNLIEKHAFRAGCSSANATHNTHTTSYSITEMDCVFNDVQHIINGDEVTQANDYSFVKGKINTLDGKVSYRDPLVEVSTGAEYDAAKKTAAETFDTAVGNCKQEFSDLENYHEGEIDNVTYSMTDANNLRDDLNTCNSEMSTRLTELNARIGNPSYSGSPQSGGTAPAVKVSSLPAKSAGSLVPYGRTIYEAVNISLGDDIGLINEVLAEADSLQFKYKDVRDKRNEYDMLKGRSKYYGN